MWKLVQLFYAIIGTFHQSALDFLIDLKEVELIDDIYLIGTGTIY